MPFYAPAIIVAVVLILMAFFVRAFEDKEGGNVNNKHCPCCEHEPLELIVKFEEPLEVNLNINIISPEPEVRGLLTIGPVSEKKDKES